MATLLPEDFLFPDIMVDSLVWLFIHSTKKSDLDVYGPDFHLKLADEK